MDPEETVPQEEPVEEEVKPVEEPTPEPAEPPKEDDPHPLSEGGRRFNEVYAGMMEARRTAETIRRENQELRERIAKVEAVKEQAPQAQPKFYSEAELQEMVDAAKITPAVMARQLAWQEVRIHQAEIDKRNQEQSRASKVESTRGEARREVQSYIDAIPALRDTRSAEYTKVAQAAQDISAELELPLDDPRVHRRALREALGTLDRVRNRAKDREMERRGSSHSETRPGGPEGTRSSRDRDPFRDVPAAFMENWKKRGLSREDMLAEMEYIPRK